MNPDKFLTDLAALHSLDVVKIEWRGFWHDNDGRYEVTLGKMDNAQPHGWLQHYGNGPTVEAAMQDARAKLADYNGAAA